MILVGGVAELYQGDLDLGRHAVMRLSAMDLGEDVQVEELSYGGVAVTQRLQDLQPDALLLVACHPRGRVPGSIERREVGPVVLTPEELQIAVGDAVVGYVTVDLLVEVATALGAMPPKVVSFEVEPAVVEPLDELSPAALAALDQVVEAVRDEVAALRQPAADD